MKQKLLNALKEGYKQLGLSEAAFERVATFGETFITSDEQIATFVKGAEPMLKAEQSAADKVRTELNAKIKGLEGEKAELEAKLNGNQPNPTTPEPPKPADNPTDMEVLLSRLLDAKLETIIDKVNGIEAAKAKESTVAALDKYVSEWDYAKGFPKEAAEAKRIAMKLYAKGGESMTAEELIAEFRGEFDPAVSNKGVTDFTKPFESDGGGGDDSKARFEAFAKRQAKRAAGTVAE